MHLPTTLLTFATLASHTLSVPAHPCTAARRISIANQIPAAYNQQDLGASAAGFAAVPFADDCVTSLYADGLPGIPVAVTGNTTRGFALTTRQVFSQVTGQYVDFPANGTTDIVTNVTLGALHAIALPVTFYANVYLDFNLTTCEIGAVRAFAKIPTEVLGILLDNPDISDVSLVS